jgi:hypothetical protein
MFTSRKMMPNNDRDLTNAQWEILDSLFHNRHLVEMAEAVHGRIDGPPERDSVDLALRCAVGRCSRPLSFLPILPFIRVVVPVLVVPTGALFQIDFNAAGDIHKHAHSVEEATLFIDHAWSTDKGIEGRLYYAMSHLHIVTFDALRKVTKRWMGEQGFFRTFEET